MVKAEEATTAQPPDIFHVERDEAYLRLLREEEAFWDSHVETPLTRTPLAPVQAYLNERMTGDKDKRWFQAIDGYGSFRSGCILGAGPGHVEEHLLGRHDGLTLRVYDISGEALARLKERVEQQFPGRLATQQEDLNFVSLPPDSYDLMIANSSLHHIVNLEHLAYQVNQALTPGGYFFFEDTTSESYFQFTDEKKRFYETLVTATQGADVAKRIRWPDRANWTFSPFESVRSAEIPEVFGRYLDEQSVRTAGAIMALTIFVTGGPVQAKPRGGWRRLRRLALALRDRLRRRRMDVARDRALGELLFKLDALMCDHGGFLPGLAFGVYRKRGAA